jgi:putative phosphotransacetylase
MRWRAAGQPVGAGGNQRHERRFARSGRGRGQGRQCAARLALDVFVRAIRHYVGAFMLELGGVDVITFSGGIGENSAAIRARSQGLAPFGIELDERSKRDGAIKGEGEISTPAPREGAGDSGQRRSDCGARDRGVWSAKRARRHGLWWAGKVRQGKRRTGSLMASGSKQIRGFDRSVDGGADRAPGGARVPGTRKRRAGAELTVQASSRHMHVCREDMDVLFGPGTELTFDRPLFQEGNFAAKETVTIVGPRSRLISNLRILGPMRKQSQVELAFTDAIMLGFNDLPVRLSGNIAGTPGAVIIGPKGVVELKEGVIRAAIHVHMNPKEAAYFGVKQGRHDEAARGRAVGSDLQQGSCAHRSNIAAERAYGYRRGNACGLHLTRTLTWSFSSNAREIEVTLRNKRGSDETSAWND